MKNINVVIIALMILAMVSCSKDEDRTSPVAEIMTPVSSSIYYRGENIFVNASFTDDESGLDECVISISSLKATKGWDDPWMPEADVIALSGMKDEIKDYILFNGAIPLDIMSGSYIISFRVTDKAGNMANYSREITIE